LRYAESLSQTHLGVRIPKSTLRYWEVRHGDVVGEVLKALLRLLSLMDYDYSVVDSTKFTDWLKGPHELFIDVRVFDAWASFEAYYTVSPVAAVYVAYPGPRDPHDFPPDYEPLWMYV
jgi:hypothetical protein